MESLESAVEFEKVSCFKCPKCEFVSLVKSNVSEHWKKEHQSISGSDDTTESSDFLLDECDDESSPQCENENLSKEDNCSNVVSSGFVCSMGNCTVRHTIEMNAQYHTKCHHESSFKCPECGETKLSWKAMAMHAWKSHLINLELLSFPMCGYKTGKRELLKFHIKTHSDQRTCLCDECGKGFKNMKQLRNHKVTILTPMTIQNKQ